MTWYKLLNLIFECFEFGLEWTVYAGAPELTHGFFELLAEITCAVLADQYANQVT